jgi:DNA-binding MurR/RpiR family transcriptional regulator
MKRVATPTTERPRTPRPRTTARISGPPPAKPTVSSEHQSLSKYIQARFEECSRSQKDVAQYIVDHLDEAAFQTAEELARHANTSSSTVVRFSQALGFEGFPELQAAAREEYRRIHAKPAVNGVTASPRRCSRSTRTSSRRR